MLKAQKNIWVLISYWEEFLIDVKYLKDIHYLLRHEQRQLKMCKFQNIYYSSDRAETIEVALLYEYSEIMIE